MPNKQLAVLTCQKMKGPMSWLSGSSSSKISLWRRRSSWLIVREPTLKRIQQYFSRYTLKKWECEGRCSRAGGVSIDIRLWINSFNQSFQFASCNFNNFQSNSSSLQICRVQSSPNRRHVHLAPLWRNLPSRSIPQLIMWHVRRRNNAL